MKTNIFIPKRLNVGYQNRRDTYTGKLAYIIYYDEQGKLRKEKSWESWRDTKIPNEEFDNVPTSGFVLNKKVGDYSTGWDHRQAYCRVYDPRNFEFEITIENLLYILENTSCIPGKGLEGEFVYGWQGTELILIPVCSPDYTSISEYTHKIASGKQFKMNDLKIGYTYKNKEGAEYIYMGKYETFEQGYVYKDPHTQEKKVTTDYYKIPYKSSGSSSVVDYICSYLSAKEKLWFAQRNKSRKWVGDVLLESDDFYYTFERYRNVPKTFIECSSENCCNDYSNIYESMQKQPEFSPPDTSRLDFIPYTLEDFKAIIKKQSEDRYVPCYVCRHGIFSSEMHLYSIELDKDNKLTVELNMNPRSDILNQYALGKINIKEAIKELSSKCYVNTEHNSAYSWEKQNISRYFSNPMTIEEFFKLFRPGYIQAYLKNGKPYRTFCEYN